MHVLELQAAISNTLLCGSQGSIKPNRIACDFCRVRKPSKFKPEHVEVTSTDEGKFQGPTCALSVHNTEVVPLCKERKAALSVKSGTASEQVAPKKNKKTKSGLTTAQLEKERDREYQELLRETAEQNQHNEKIAQERQREKRDKIEGTRPKWYQQLSYKQVMYVEMLGESLLFDLQEGILTRTQCVVAGLGIFPRPHIKDIFQAAYKCFMNPILFLLYLYKQIGKTPLKPAAKYFYVNDRLLLSAVAHLALPRTLLDLYARLPVLPPKKIKEYPATAKRKRTLYTSPYLEPLPFLKHCFEEEERKKMEKRRKYLNRIQEQTQAEKREVVELLTVQATPGTKEPVTLGFSRKQDGHDQIPTLAQRRASCKTPDRIVRRSSAREKQLECESKASDDSADKCGDNAAAEGGDNNDVDENFSDSYTENIESEQLFSETFREIIQGNNNESAKENMSLENSNGNEEANLQKLDSQDLQLQTSLSEINLDDGPISDKSSSDQLSEMITYLEPHDSAPLSCPTFPETLPQHGGSNAMQETHLRPIFLSLQEQFPRSEWCACRADRSIRPIFTENTCGYPPPFEEPEAIVEPEVDLVAESSTELLLRQACMQLPHPIPTRPTIRAMMAGYWQQVLYPSCPSTLSPDTLKSGVKNTFTALTKKALFEMAKHGNPLACLPNVHLLPKIQQFIRERTNFNLVKQVKEKLLLESYKQWNETLGHSRTVQITNLKFDQKVKSWDHIKALKKMVNKHAAEYRSKVRQTLVDDAQDFWSTMFMDYFNNPGFQSVFFAYLPSKEDDIYPVHPWE